MTDAALAAALRACAAGFHPHEAGVALLTSSAMFLRRDDFAGFIERGISITDQTTQMAAIDWDAAITALNAGELPCSGGEGGSSGSRPASPAAFPSTSKTLSPGSTTATSST